ncbi:hypothetical protein BDW66DRAFT_132428 [Aspergillus desertorum]
MATGLLPCLILEVLGTLSAMASFRNSGEQMFKAQRKAARYVPHCGLQSYLTSSTSKQGVHDGVGHWDIFPAINPCTERRFWISSLCRFVCISSSAEIGRN